MDTDDWPKDELIKLSTVWTIFALANETDYEIPAWELNSHCGYWEQQCGDHCDASEDCTTKNHEEAGLWNALTLDKENWCHRVTKSGSTSHKAYKLHPIWNLALITWAGWLSKQPSNPGWTIHDSEDLINYTKHAQILDPISRSNLKLKQLYVTEKHGVFSEKHIKHLSKPPAYAVNYSKTDCWTNTLAHSLIHSRLSSVHAQNNHRQNSLAANESDLENPGSLHLYTIFKKSKNFLQTLENQILLTDKGLNKYSKKLDKTITFFDPAICSSEVFQ